MPKYFRSNSLTMDEQLLALKKKFIVEGDSGANINILKGILVLYRRFIKRMIDMVVSTLLIFSTLPFMVVIAILIRLTSKGPIFYRQERVGYRGRIFYIWKFRTMHHKSGVEDEHQSYIKHLLTEEAEGKDKKSKDYLVLKHIEHVEKNTTPLGRFLRATSLDELPQLFNIFIGDMSLVGPRPHPVYEVEEYKKWYRRRLDVKPGLTGWSKLNIRNTTMDYEKSILYDLWYVDNWNLLIDFKILLKTIPFVIAMKDSY